jgi:hypothetical protein
MRTADMPASRPIGVTILAVIYLIAGGASMFSLLVLLARYRHDVRTFPGYEFEWVIFNVLLFTGLSIASGVGMWAGRRWGWWITVVNLVAGAIYQVCSLARVMMGNGPYAGFVELEHIALTNGLSVLIVLLVVLYFFKGNVVSYFGLQDKRRSNLLARMLGISVLVSLAYFALDYVG